MDSQILGTSSYIDIQGNRFAKLIDTLQAQPAGILHGDMNIVYGKTRSSYYTREIFMRQIRDYKLIIRKEKIKNIIDSLS